MIRRAKYSQPAKSFPPLSFSRIPGRTHLDTKTVALLLPAHTPLFAPIYLAASKNWYGLLPARLSLKILLSARSRRTDKDEAVKNAVAKRVSYDGTPIYFGICDPYKAVDDPTIKLIGSLSCRLSFWALRHRVSRTVNLDDAHWQKIKTIYTYPKGMTAYAVVAFLKNELRGQSRMPWKPKIEQCLPGTEVTHLVSARNTREAVAITSDPSYLSDKLVIAYSFAQHPFLSHYLTSALITRKDIETDMTLDARGSDLAFGVTSAIQLALMDLRQSPAESLRVIGELFPNGFDGNWSQAIKTILNEEILPHSLVIDMATLAGGHKRRLQAEKSWHKRDTDAKLLAKLTAGVDNFYAERAFTRYVLRSVPAVPRPDVLFVVALQDELDSLEDLLEKRGMKVREARDSAGQTLKWCTVEDIHHKERVFAMARATDMGETAAASAASRLIAELSRVGRPRCIAMTGICGGNSRKVRLGDLVVADRLFKFDDGKIEALKERSDTLAERDVFSDIRTFILPPLVRRDLEVFSKEWNKSPGDSGDLTLMKRPQSMTQLKYWYLFQLGCSGSSGLEIDVLKKRSQSEEREWDGVLDTLLAIRPSISEKEAPELGTGWVHLKRNRLVLTGIGKEAFYRLAATRRDKPWNVDRDRSRVVLGPMATGARVQKDETLVDHLKKLLRDIMAVEMEGAAIAAVAHENSIPCIVVKGVVDHLDRNKDDMFRIYASRLSAAFLIEFFLHYGASSGLFEDV